MSIKVVIGAGLEPVFASWHAVLQVYPTAVAVQSSSSFVTIQARTREGLTLLGGAEHEVEAWCRAASWIAARAGL